MTSTTVPTTPTATSTKLYYDVENWCQYHIHRGSDFLFNGHNAFMSTLKGKCDELAAASSSSAGDNKQSSVEQTVQFPLDSLHSFFGNLHTKHVKNAAYRLRSNISRYVDFYRDGNSILSMAKQSNIPPYLMCRQIVEHICDLRAEKNAENQDEGENDDNNQQRNNTHKEYNSKDPKKRLTMAMRDPLGVLNDRNMILPTFLDTEDKWMIHRTTYKENGDSSTSVSSTITTTRIAHEVATAIQADPLCGPDQDRLKHFIGIEYEVVLERQLSKLGIPFEAEARLRELGTSKTPDVVLLVPVAFQVGSECKVVNWIDSKAMYGDVETHRTSVYPQAKTYIHRYGPGMILYWFGHAPIPLLESGTGHNDDLFVCSRRLPSSFMWPTGEIIETSQTLSEEEEDVS